LTCQRKPFGSAASKKSKRTAPKRSRSQPCGPTLNIPGMRAWPKRRCQHSLPSLLTSISTCVSTLACAGGNRAKKAHIRLSQPVPRVIVLWPSKQTDRPPCANCTDAGRVSKLTPSTLGNSFIAALSTANLAGKLFKESFDAFEPTFGLRASVRSFFGFKGRVKLFQQLFLARTQVNRRFHNDAAQ